MTNLKVDLYSDTVSRPTPAMRRAMAEAEVGNEQAGEDPTVNRLCEMVAELTGKEAAVYLPSGTMCNAIAYRVHCQQGDEVILDKTGHPLSSESGGPAALSGVMTRPLDGVRGIFTPEQVRAAVNDPKNNHAPLSRLVSVENTVNFGGGKVWPLDAITAVTAEARKHGLATHMDGARLLNAVVASGTSARDYAESFDSLWIDLSKGLGCPVGGVLAGSKDFIRRSWRFKHQFGGAMRQAGIIAAAGVHALEHHVERLADDHANAKAFAEIIADIPGIEIDPSEVETNILFFTTPGRQPTEIRDALIAKGVRIGAMGQRMRAVFHIDVDADGTRAAADTLREVMTA
ncbi:MAG: threonine aldolase family protein [Alphaproteobacteria bacterium]